MGSTRISFRVSDPSVERTLQIKKKSGEMSAYINETLQFYQDDKAHDLAEIKQTLIQIKYMLAKMENVQGCYPR